MVKLWTINNCDKSILEFHKIIAQFTYKHQYNLTKNVYSSKAIKIHML